MSDAIRFASRRRAPTCLGALGRERARARSRPTCATCDGAVRARARTTSPSGAPAGARWPDRAPTSGAGRRRVRSTDADRCRTPCCPACCAGPRARAEPPPALGHRRRSAPLAAACLVALAVVLWPLGSTTAPAPQAMRERRSRRARSRARRRWCEGVGHRDRSAVPLRRAGAPSSCAVRADGDRHGGQVPRRRQLDARRRSRDRLHRRHATCRGRTRGVQITAPGRHADPAARRLIGAGARRAAGRRTAPSIRPTSRRDRVRVLAWARRAWLIASRTSDSASSPASAAADLRPDLRDQLRDPLGWRSPGRGR